MRAIEVVRTFFERAGEPAAVYLYGRYGSGPSYPDTDIELGLVFPEGVGEDEIQDYLERISDAGPLGGEPGILMPFALNTHIPPVVHEILVGGSLLVDNDPRARTAFVEQARRRIESARPSLLEDAREAIMQARALGLALTTAQGYVLPQPPRFLDPVRIGWRLSRILASVAVLEATTREMEAAARDPDRLGQVIGWFSNAAGAATGIAKAMLNIFEMERPPRRWQVFIPIADAGLIPMDLALALGSLVELRWQLMGTGGLITADRILMGIRGGLPHLVAFARQAAWYCEVPAGPGEAKVH
ncbi:MAG: nucleotidyltransferase domain-containing protein [Armatimonadota bacterium]|nr:nucleotidyltransferase domain-containing protein [Armatimonadota bacterium]MDR7518522.1 nucleotidyltransferase domain-containing protein [Armatimonadota bacterium]MDR7550432.1 nucleotidyltransferase domain-containing protein [Armatimonadota bacterium]